MGGRGDRLTVGVAGDWHGNTRWAVHALTCFHEAGVSEVWHLGDFGLWPKGDRYLNDVEGACARLGITILVTPGNHEDYDQLPAGGGTAKRMRDHIIFLPRGHRFELNGWTVLSFGGAPSIDFEHRVEGVSWWPAELPTEEHVDIAIAGGPCDILLAHDSSDAPHVTDPVDRILRSNAAGWSDRGLAYARTGRERLTRLRAGVKPQILLHGHYHVAGVAQHADGSRTISLGADGTDGNLGLLEVPPKETGEDVTFSFLTETRTTG